MKKNVIIAVLIMAFSFTAYAQRYRYNYGMGSSREDYSSNLYVSLESFNIQNSEKKLIDYLQNQNIIIKLQESSKNQIKIEFDMPIKDLNLLNIFLATLGYIEDKNYYYIDHNIAVTQLDKEIKDLKVKNDTTNRIEYKEAQLAMLEKNADLTFVSIILCEEYAISDNIKFVNMPGFEYGMLFVENPEKGLTAPTYQTYTLKYLFTRGKSYFALSLMKAQDYDKSDSTLYSEYFMLNFGQDFYTRYLGRGKRKYFNPYTSYQIGCFLASNKREDNKFMFNLNVALGLELIKTRIFLLDSKVSYFLPINNQNAHMRGWQAGISANVLF